MPSWRKNDVRDFWMSGPEMALPQVLSAVSLGADGAAESSQLRIVFGQVYDYVRSVRSRVAADGAKVLLDALRPDVLVPEDCLAFSWLKEV